MCLWMRRAHPACWLCSFCPARYITYMKKYAHQATLRSKAGPAADQDGLGTAANPRKRRKVGARADSGGPSSAKDAKASSSTAAAQGMKEKLGDPQLLRPLRLIIVGHNPSEVGRCLLLLSILVLGSLDEFWMCHHDGRETALTQKCARRPHGAWGTRMHTLPTTCGASSSRRALHHQA